MLACPFAKGNPTKQIQCLIIGRQNLSGAKEHIKRNHFNKLLPQDIRRAKKWSDVFDICNPQWPPRPHPSPFVDVAERWQQMQSSTHDPQDMIAIATSSRS